MPYELTIATKQTPGDGPGRTQPEPPLVSTLVLTGSLDEHATKAILATVAKVGVEGANSIVVEFKDVVADDTTALDALVDGIMSLRTHGAEVQIFAPDDALHEQLAALPKSRDWLLWRASDGSALPRKTLHVDANNGSPLKA